MPARTSQHALIKLLELTHIDDITFEVWSPRGILSVSEIYVSETNVFETNLKRVEFSKKDLRTLLFVDLDPTLLETFGEAHRAFAAAYPAIKRIQWEILGQ